MFERFNDEARLGIVNTTNEARRLNQKQSTTVHLLLALVYDGTSQIGQLFAAAGVTRDLISFWSVEDVGFTVGDLPTHIPMAPEIRKVIERAEKDTVNEGYGDVTPARLVLSMLAQQDCSVYTMLRTFDVDVPELRALVKQLA